LWTEKKPAIDGRYVHYDQLLLEPKPVQRRYPPI
jgi:alkanesulfonate monooxygenase SsuD/methylene tetrahydromethanopterin reductase-like flavin-dependent oxidoreductase (luciferase family)